MKSNLFFTCLTGLLVLSGCISTGSVYPTAIPSVTPKQSVVVSINKKTDTPNDPVIPTETLSSSTVAKTEFAPTIDWWNEESTKSIAIGNKIIEAIDRYYLENGVYPNTLSDLVPDYLNEIPKTITGHGFAFVLHSPDYFTLKFPYTRRSNDVVSYACGYSDGPDHIGEWECTHLLSYP